MSALQKPYPVAPVIKGVRYVLLTAGFIYGIAKSKALVIYDKPYKRQRLEILKKIAEEGKNKTKVEYRGLLVMFGEFAGLKFPPNWEPPF